MPMPRPYRFRNMCYTSQSRVSVKLGNLFPSYMLFCQQRWPLTAISEFNLTFAISRLPHSAAERCPRNYRTFACACGREIARCLSVRSFNSVIFICIRK